ncbi:MAG: DUF6279 family lipoprotein, partial [Steroidobacteraceae bacterium]
RTAEDRVPDREKPVRKGIERITGALDARQRAVVAAYAADARPFMFEWRDNRRRWREELAATLRLRQASPELFASRMQVLVAQPDRLWSDEYRKALLSSRGDFLELLLRIDATLSPAQRRTASRRLLELADEVRALAPRR